MDYRPDRVVHVNKQKKMNRDGPTESRPSSKNGSTISSTRKNSSEKRFRRYPTRRSESGWRSLSVALANSRETVHKIDSSSGSLWFPTPSVKFRGSIPRARVFLLTCGERRASIPGDERSRVFFRQIPRAASSIYRSCNDDNSDGGSRARRILRERPVSSGRNGFSVRRVRGRRERPVITDSTPIIPGRNPFVDFVFL